MEDVLSTITNFFTESSDSDVIHVGEDTGVAKFYKKVAEKYNMDELKDILDFTEKSLLIVSGAGSGKTTSLILKILRDALNGDLYGWVTIDGVKHLRMRKVLVSTFLKSGAEDIARKFDDICKEFKIEGISSADISFKTIHSEVYQALIQMGINININEEKANSLISNVCSYYKVRSVMSKGKKGLTKDEYSDISCIFSYARNRLDKSRYEHPLMSEYDLDELTLQAMLQMFSTLKKANGIQDFEDLEEQLYDGYQKFPAVLNFIKHRYDYIYVDEFQDTSQLQYEILKPYLESAKRFICIGDDDQCIYGWRGSDISLIRERLELDFKVATKQLTTNYRCSDVILKAVIPSIEQNSFRHPKKLRAAKPGGCVNIVVDGGISYLIQSVKEDLARGESIGILGRTNADLLIPAVLLQLDGCNDFSVSKSLSLSDRIPSQVLGIMDLILMRYTEEFEGYLKLFLNRYNGYQATNLCQTLSTTPEYSLFNIPLDDLRYSAPDLFPILRALREEVKVSPVKGYIYLLQVMEQDVYNGKTIYAQRARDFTYYIRKIIQEYPTLQDKSLNDLDTLFNVNLKRVLETKKPKSSIRMQDKKGRWYTEKAPIDESKVKITTVHDAKGKEWTNVYIWNDVDGCFPNSVGNRILTPEEKEEERRVHYIAWTRPLKKLTVFTRSDRSGGFLNECDLTDSNIIDLREVKSSTENLDALYSSKKEVFRKKNAELDDITNNDPLSLVKNYLKKYYEKYTSSTWVMTNIGNNLDICEGLLGGYSGLVDFLMANKLYDYPSNMIEETITQLFEEKTLKD